MAAARFYSSTSGAMNLMADVTDADTSITVDSVAGLPGTRPYAVVLDPGTASEEIVDVTNASGTTLTITRGVDGSSAQAHAAGVGNVRHMATARDFREAQEHIAASAAVHGLTGSVVGTSDVQTLTNKTLDDVALTGTADVEILSATATAVGATPVVVTAASALQTADLQQWSNGVAAVAKVNGKGRFTGYATNLIVEGDASNTPAIKIPEELNEGRTVPQVEINTRADDTADSVQVKKGGTVVVKIDKSGNLTSPTITALTAADTALDGRLDTIEAANRPKSSTAKKDKQLHWGLAEDVVTNSSGFVTVTHGAGFTPTVVKIEMESVAWQHRVTAKTSTTFTVQIMVDNATPVGVRTETFSYICGE